MILPIVPYGDPILRVETQEISEGTDVGALISDMFETMYHANGVGLAAPQIGKALRLFVVDGSPFAELEDIDTEEAKTLETFKKVFINPIIVEEFGSEWAFEEGCLSIPGINADVYRKNSIVIEYYTENWELVEETYSSLTARIIQHEYDHIEGVLFTDLLSPLKKKFLSKKLSKITVGDVSTNYKMRKIKKRR